MIVDFTEIKTGEEFQEFVEDLLRAGNFHPQAGGRGPDGGKDLIVTADVEDGLGAYQRRRYLVECKHYAHSARAVTPSDVGNVVHKITKFEADAYLLVTSTTVTNNLMEELDAISTDPRLPFVTLCWNRNRLQQELLKHDAVFATYFPRSFAQYRSRIAPLLARPAEAMPSVTTKSSVAGAGTPPHVRIWGGMSGEVLVVPSALESHLERGAFLPLTEFSAIIMLSQTLFQIYSPDLIRVVAANAVPPTYACLLYTSDAADE